MEYSLLSHRAQSALLVFELWHTNPSTIQSSSWCMRCVSARRLAADVVIHSDIRKKNNSLCSGFIKTLQLRKKVPAIVVVVYCVYIYMCIISILSGVQIHNDNIPIDHESFKWHKRQQTVKSVSSASFPASPNSPTPPRPHAPIVQCLVCTTFTSLRRRPVHQ